MKNLSVLLLSCLVAAVLGDNSRPDGANGQQIAENTCVFWGDPHIWTFDSAFYSYQDPGWHHIFISPTVNVQANFVVGCYTPIPTNACAKDMRIFVLDENNQVNVLELYLSDVEKDGFVQVYEGSLYYQILINSQDTGLFSVWDPVAKKVTFPGVQPGVGVQIGSAENGFAYFFLSQQNTIFQLQFKLNSDVVISHIPDVLTISPLNARVQSNSLYNQICGLCGTFNGNPYDDFLLHGKFNHTIQLSDQNIDYFGNTWAVDYTVSGSIDTTPVPVNKSGVFSCNFNPTPTPSPSNPPSPTPAPPTRAPPTATPSAPTPSPTNPPTNGPTPSPSPTPSATPRPTPAPTPSQTPSPTYPPTTPATQPPTNPPTETPAPTTPATSTPAPTPTAPSNNTYNYTNVDNSTAVDNAKGTPIYQDALTSCGNAGLVEGDPLWASCMYDVTQTNTTTLAVASAGALVLAGCAHSNLTDTSCVANTLFACPGACNANGACVNGACQCNKGYVGATCVKAPLLTAAQLAGVISAGAVAGIAIGAAAFAGLAGFGAKKGYDYYHMRDNKMANVNSNPLYNEKKTGGVSPLYAEKA